jgi:glyoxylase-like metal-dependent hydrolase (beta-lactamase superfamily II)/8-oxo-dGTP pyrophosphatase MutT (NUDIX family)
MSSSDSPAVPRPAATVMLLRDGDHGLEVFLQRRVKAMRFAPSVTVFPGGGVDERDRRMPAWYGPGPSWWADRLGCAEQLAAALVCAAVRETFEECGVLLAGVARATASIPAASPLELTGTAAERTAAPEELVASPEELVAPPEELVASPEELAAPPEELVASPEELAASPEELTASPEELTAARAELVDQRASLADVLTARGWVLRADLLRPWANWITPEVESRRYDAQLFVAALPHGQHADAGTSEAVDASWWRPADALADWRAGRIELLPPTWVSLEQLAEQPDVTAALRAAERRVVSPLMPSVRRDGDSILLTLPAELGYDGPVRLRPRQLALTRTAEPRWLFDPASGVAEPAPPTGPALGVAEPAPPTGPALGVAEPPPGADAAVPRSGVDRAVPRRRGLLPEPERAAHPRYERLRPVTPIASVLLAQNPSAMTLEGTNTWLLRGPDSERVVVIDPGPLDEHHLRRVAEHGPVAQILLTHRHPDHAEGAARLAELTSAPVRALDPALVLGDEGLAEGDVVVAAGLELRVWATPGHSADSLCFLLDDAVLTGDTVLGRGTTVIAHPDGRLGDYLGSLRRLAELPDGLAVLPGHGPELPDAGAVVREYLAHREQRLEQVREALRQLGPDATPRQVVELVYADVDRALWPAAEWSVRAQLDYLRGQAG